MKSIILVLFLLTSCTIAITQAQTEGHSTDQVDNTLDPDPSVSVPISAI